MKPPFSTVLELLKAPTFVKIIALSIAFLSMIYVGRYYSDSYPSSFNLPFLSSPSSFSSSSSNTLSPRQEILLPPLTSAAPPPPQPTNLTTDVHVPLLKPPPPPPDPSPPPLPPETVVERMGIVDETGAMTDDFKVGEIDPNLAADGDEFGDATEDAGSSDGGEEVRSKVEKYRLCDQSMSDYIPCLDNKAAVDRLNSTDRGEGFERHCPREGEGGGLDCVVPPPKGYQTPIPWPQSRDQVWYSNVPHPRLAEDKGGQNWISVQGDKFVFPGGGTQFIHGADHYLDQISKMVPDIEFGHHTRVALDVGCGVASFGAFLMQRNVTTLSIAPKDGHENQIQFALERGVPAMLSAFATRRLLYPSQAFDVIHCSTCRVNWTRDDGILLLEVDRMLRAGGYFAWAAQPVYKHEESLQEQWKEMVNLTSRICWELVSKEGYIAIWRKPLNNSCYINRERGTQPPLCEENDNPDDVWYVEMKPCISRLPDNGYGGNISTWPDRLHNPPDRLRSIEMDAFTSRKELFKAESSYWHVIIESYVNAYHWNENKMRNVMDMRAGYGGFAAALQNHQLDCWVMNVVPTSGYNTLPVLYDRGLIGVMHDWCEPFDTYPRSYDLLHAAGLFSVEKKRCNISTIMLEMDRILRPHGLAYIQDSVTVLPELEEIASAMGWVCLLQDTSEGPHSTLKVLRCDKRMLGFV